MEILKDLEAGTILLVNKPIEWTSFDVVKKIKSLVKRHIPKFKIGHAGTLDPLAEGLLIICTQKMTKQVDRIHDMPKTYMATITVGANRPSYDKETEISETFSINHINKGLVEDILKSFLGKQEQFPPAFSAIKQGGKPIYIKARKGIDLKIKSREIEIYDIKLLDIQLPNIQIEVTVSKGTYIRSLAHDIGIKLNSGAYLDHLARTKIGDYRLENAIDIDEFQESIFSYEKSMKDS